MSLLSEYNETCRQVERVGALINPLREELKRHEDLRKAAHDRIVEALARGPIAMWDRGLLFVVIPHKDQYGAVISFTLHRVPLPQEEETQP